MINMKSSKKPAASLFMIMLIVFIPFCVSDAYAASVEITELKGNDGINGFIRRNDQLRMSALAEISAAEPVTYQKLRVYIDSAATYSLFNVDGCQRIAEGSPIFNCTYTEPVFGAAGTHNYRVRLYTASTMNIPGASSVATDSMDVTVDGIGAKVTSINAAPARTKGGNIEIMYSAEDYASSEGDKTSCSGVDTIEFHRGSLGGPLVKVEKTYHLCELSGSFTYDAGTTEGDFSICAKAFDQLGQSLPSAACAGYSVDRAGPQPDISSLVVVQHGTADIPIEYVGGATSANADISITIDAVDLVPGTVKADFSALGGDADAAPTGEPFVSGTSYTFYWDNVQISPDLAACVIDIYAEDTLGNSATTPVPCSIAIDQQGPQVQQILTSYPNPSDGLYYFGNRTNISAIISEPGIGLSKIVNSKHQVYMHLDAVGLGQRTPADNCTKIIGSLWVCDWMNVEPPALPGGPEDGVYTLRISGESKDDLGNIMGAAYEQQLGLDRTSPSLGEDITLNLQPGINAGAAGSGIIFTGDMLQFIVYTSDAYSTTADFSALGGSNATLPASCDMSADPPYCTFETLVYDSGPYDADITFTFMDSSGNRASTSKTVSIAGAYNETNPDFWRNAVECYPEYIDREVASVYEQPMYCYIQLTSPHHPLAEVLTFGMEDFPADCAAQRPDISITDYVQDIFVLNNVNSTEPYLFVKLQQAEFMLDNLNFTCQFEIFTKEENSYTIQPEYENISVNLLFFNLPVGELGQEYDDDIDEVEGNLEWLDGWFDGVHDVVKYCEKICKAYVALNSALAGLTALGVMFGITSKSLRGTTGHPAAHNLWKATCKGDSSAKSGVANMKAKWMDQFCALVNCKYADKILQRAGSSDVIGAVGTAESPAVQAALARGFDVKQSIIWSLATLCLPGILYNIQKWRQIWCQYGTCLISAVPTGVPQAVCDEVKGYMECKFIFGEIFNALPFAQIFSNLMTQLMQTFSDPMAALGQIIYWLADCKEACGKSEETSTVCAWTNLFSMIGDAVKEVTEITGEDYWENMGNTYCEQYEEAREDAGLDDDD